MRARFLQSQPPAHSVAFFCGAWGVLINRMSDCALDIQVISGGKETPKQLITIVSYDLLTRSKQLAERLAKMVPCLQRERRVGSGEQLTDTSSPPSRNTKSSWRTRVTISRIPTPSAPRPCSR